MLVVRCARILLTRNAGALITAKAINSKTADCGKQGAELVYNSNSNGNKAITQHANRETELTLASDGNKAVERCKIDSVD